MWIKNGSTMITRLYSHQVIGSIQVCDMFIHVLSGMILIISGINYLHKHNIFFSATKAPHDPSTRETCALLHSCFRNGFYHKKTLQEESLVKKPYKYKKYYMFYLSICCNWKYIYLGTFEAVCWWFYDLVTFSFIFRHSVTFLRSRFWWLSLHVLYPLFVVSVYTQVHLLGSVVWVVSFCNSILFFLSCLACFSSVSQVLGFACLSLVLSVCVSFSFI